MEHYNGKNITGLAGIHHILAEADGSRFADCETNTIVGKEGKYAIVTLTERRIISRLMERLRQTIPNHWKKPSYGYCSPTDTSSSQSQPTIGWSSAPTRLSSRLWLQRGTKHLNLVFLADSYSS